MSAKGFPRAGHPQETERGKVGPATPPPSALRHCLQVDRPVQVSAPGHLCKEAAGPSSNRRLGFRRTQATPAPTRRLRELAPRFLSL